MTTAFMALEFGWPVTPSMPLTADGHKVVAFVCGEAPQNGHTDRRYVELFICGARPKGAVHITGLAYAVWFEIEQRLDLFKATEVLGQIKLAEARLEEAWRAGREMRRQRPACSPDSQCLTDGCPSCGDAPAFGISES